MVVEGAELSKRKETKENKLQEVGATPVAAWYSVFISNAFFFWTDDPLK